MYRNYIKRFLDVTFSILLLIILFPLFLVISIITYIELGRPIIFKQTREGKNKKEFTMLKFRTMDFNEGAKRESRMTKVTSFFDKIKVNELPQLINVLKGDMSIVGPRAFIPGDILPKKPPKERYKVKPGMTGLAQVNGGRFITHNKKLEYDIIYNKKISFILDLKIVLKTPYRIIKDFFK